MWVTAAMKTVLRVLYMQLRYCLASDPLSAAFPQAACSLCDKMRGPDRSLLTTIHKD